MDRDGIDTFEKLKGQLDGLQQEISVLAKKSPNDALNAFKMRFVNATIGQCNAFFGAPFDDFTEFSADDLPSNSDVTFILAQYIERAEKYRADNIERLAGQWYWRTDDNDKIRTAEPKKLTNK